MKRLITYQIQNSPIAAFLILIATVCLSCSTGKSKAPKEVVLEEKSDSDITMMELTGNDKEDDKVNSKSKNQKSKKKSKFGKRKVKTASRKERKSKSISAAAKKQCIELVARIAGPYRELYEKLDKTTYIKEESDLEQMVQITPAVCEQSGTFSQAAAVMNAATAHHTGKLGIIMPLTGKNNQLTTFMVKGMRAAFVESQLNFESASVIKDSTSRNPETLLAELVFKDKVSAVIGGFETIDAQVLAKWSERLMLPVVITNNDRNVGNLSRYAYMLYPDEMRLAYTLAAEAERRGIKRIAILKPINHKSDKLVDYFKEAFTARGGQIAYDLLFTPGNFDSMQAVSRTMFKVDASERVDEYRAAYRRARRNAQAQGAPFDPRMVVLKPIITFDAVFLPDDFRTARHFAKLFKFHQVDKLTMIGNHEWRSPALIEPFDEFMEGSFFADFIGSYSKLPPAISAPTSGSPFFVQPSSVLAVDFQLIGYRAGRVGSIIANYKNVSRRQLPNKIDTITSNSSSFFGDGMVFERDHQSNWPTYIFGVTNGTIQIEKEHTKLNLPGSDQKSSQLKEAKTLTSAKPG